MAQKEIIVAVFDENPSDVQQVMRVLSRIGKTLKKEFIINAYSNISSKLLDHIEVANWPQLVICETYFKDGTAKDLVHRLISKAYSLRLPNPTFINFSSPDPGQAGGTKLYFASAQKYDFEALEAKILLCSEWLTT